MVAAAVVAAHVGRKQRELRASLQEAKEAEERLERTGRFDQVLDQLSPNGELLDAHDLETVLKATFHVRQPNPFAMRRVLNLVEHKDGYFPPDAVLDGVEMYHEYMEMEARIEQIFRNYNKAKDGNLTKKEVGRVLQDEERKNKKRAAKGMAITLIVSPQDVDAVIKKADTSGNGRIDRSELLSAFEAWEVIALEKMELKQMASCGGCLIL